MSEVCHHATTLALCHVQGLALGPQHIKTTISTHTPSLNVKHLIQLFRQ